MLLKVNTNNYCVPHFRRGSIIPNAVQVVLRETIPEQSVARVPLFTWDNPVAVIGSPRARYG